MVRPTALTVGDHAVEGFTISKAKGEKMVIEPPMNIAQRRKLGDITNIEKQNKLLNAKQQQEAIVVSSIENAENLKKENMRLMNAVVEREIKSELQKFRIALQKVHEQNLLLAQANTRILADFNTSKDQLKILQHELGCKNGLIMARKTLLKEQIFPCTCTCHASKVKPNDGPFTVKHEVYNGTRPSLVPTTYSWTKVSIIIYLDQPVGTGFSYSRTQLLNKPSDLGEAMRITEFLHKWLDKHQEFSSNPLYVCGDSYSGMVVPALVHEISTGNYLCCKPPINLKGYVLGNPLTEKESDFDYRIPYAHGMALISDELYESLKRLCKGKYTKVDPRNTECLKLLKEYEKCITRINLALIHTPLCEETSPDCYSYRYVLTTYWANDKSVRRVLKANKKNVGEWVRCKWDMPYTVDIKSSVPYHLNNSVNGYFSLIFSGDHDMKIPFLGTQAWIRSFNYSIIDDWRPWMIDDQVAGYTRTYANKMTFATIKGGGHTPESKPEETYMMFQRWINGQPL